ncbi:hypothetical protein FO519_005433 [Halicephalobus sp. NKZ332]|nr:hypothetical protein FO519_005433 [Halicephalobus sp. NKZ332]
MGKTYFVSDRKMLRHRCEWDPKHIEVPERLERILDKVESSGILKECDIIESRMATEEEILLVHGKEYFSSIKESVEKTIDQNEKLSSCFEDIYINEFTFECAMLAAGSALEVMEKVLQNPGSNGFAAIRPPGHHAGPNEGCGFCVFNNVAICAKKARQSGLKKVIIVDFDVHAGQGTQYCIEDDPGILLISIHRYEGGHFWPNLPESNVKTGYKQTINVPVEQIGMGDAEYLSFMDILVRPAIRDFNPELILVSCGFDASFGDREGEMRVTPAGFGYLVGSLASLNIPLAVLLEGGYFLEAIPEDAYCVMKSLVEKKPVDLPLGYPVIVGVVSNFVDHLLCVMKTHEDRFPTFKIIVEQFLKHGNRKLEKHVIEYTGTRMCTFPFPTRQVYGEFEQLEDFTKEFHENLMKKYDDPFSKKKMEINFLEEISAVGLGLDGNNVVGIFPSEDEDLREEEIIFCYYCIYLPLSWKFDLDWKVLESLIRNCKGKESGSVALSRPAVLSETVLGSILYKA